jgi:hypothetical protein
MSKKTQAATEVAILNHATLPERIDAIRAEAEGIHAENIRRERIAIDDLITQTVTGRVRQTIDALLS